MSFFSRSRAVLVSMAALFLSACGSDQGSSFGTGPDPYYPQQWHLNNTGQITGVVGADINVEPAWNEGVKGNGTVIAIVDDGLEIAHEDLAPNVLAGKSYNYRDRSNDPTPLPYSGLNHGTAVAGLAAARDLNGVGVRGVAPRAQLVGFNAVASSALSADVLDAMTRNMDIVSVSNNSWGFDPDGTGELYPAEGLWAAGVEAGVANGRGGKGTVYVWAAGNGYARGSYDNVDNSNYDDQANSPYVIAACAVATDGSPAYYSERGANLWVCAPAGGGQGVLTTDLMGDDGTNSLESAGLEDISDASYTNSFTGTSAASPMISGVVALMLEANPDLTWRDVRLILAETASNATPAGSPSSAEWTTTSPAPGQPRYNINHNFGFGIVDASAAVQRAATWNSVGGFDTQKIVPFLPAGFAQVTIAAGASESRTITVDQDLIIEYVEILFDATHADRGDLEIVLTAPSGTRSVLAEQHECFPSSTDLEFPPPEDCSRGYDADGGWIFGTARHLGESSTNSQASGDWNLTVNNRSAAYDATWNNWSIKIYGR